MKCKGVQNNNNTVCVFKSKDIYCLPPLKERLNEGSEMGQSRGIVVGSVVPATALIVKLSWLRLQSVMIRPSAV